MNGLGVGQNLLGNNLREDYYPLVVVLNGFLGVHWAGGVLTHSHYPQNSISCIHIDVDPEQHREEQKAAHGAEHVLCWVYQITTQWRWTCIFIQQGVSYANTKS